MDRDIATQWVADLRSGNFAQGYKLLHRADDKMCCLGVLSDQAYRLGRCGRKLQIDAYHYGSVEDTDEISRSVSYIHLPRPVVDWAAAHSPSGRLPFMSVVGSFVHLTDLNDAEFSFDQIADVIEFFWEEL